MTKAGRLVILIYLALRMWISHQTISSGVKLRETVQTLQNAGHQRCSPLQRGHVGPRGFGSQAHTAGIVVCSEREGLRVFEPVCSRGRVSALCETTIYCRIALLVKHNRKLEFLGNQVPNVKPADRYRRNYKKGDDFSPCHLAGIIKIFIFKKRMKRSSFSWVWSWRVFSYPSPMSKNWSKNLKFWVCSGDFYNVLICSPILPKGDAWNEDMVQVFAWK